MGAACSVAEYEMHHLSRNVLPPGGLVLTDSDGVIVHYTGAIGFTDLAQRAGMREGAIWSEAEQGTNGMGTCLVEQIPVLIQRNDHYLRKNAGFACCAAPIHDSTGAVVGSLNFSCEAELGRAPTLSLIIQATRVIEDRSLLETSKDQYVLRFHLHRSVVTTFGEGLLVIGKDGYVQGANQHALDWLGVECHENVLNRPAQDLVGLPLAQLVSLFSGRSVHPKRLTGTDLFGLLVFPEANPEKSTHGEGSAKQVLAVAERNALLDVLASHDWNVASSAKSLAVGRKTLYRKMQRLEIQRPG